MQKCMGALKRSWYGLVEIDPPNDQIVLQAHSSQQDYSKRPKDIYAQIELSEQGKAMGLQKKIFWRRTISGLTVAERLRPNRW